MQRAKGYIRIQVPKGRTVKWQSKAVQSQTTVYVCVVWRESDGRRAGDASLRSWRIMASSLRRSSCSAWEFVSRIFGYGWSEAYPQDLQLFSRPFSHHLPELVSHDADAGRAHVELLAGAGGSARCADADPFDLFVVEIALQSLLFAA